MGGKRGFLEELVTSGLGAPSPSDPVPFLSPSVSPGGGQPLKAVVPVSTGFHLHSLQESFMEMLGEQSGREGEARVFRCFAFLFA